MAKEFVVNRVSWRPRRTGDLAQKLPSTAIYCHFGAAKPLSPLQPFHSHGRLRKHDERTALDGDVGLESPTYVKTQNAMNEATIACENVTMNPRLTAMSGRTAQPTSMRHAEFDERTGALRPG